MQHRKQTPVRQIRDFRVNVKSIPINRGGAGGGDGLGEDLIDNGVGNGGDVVIGGEDEAEGGAVRVEGENAGITASTFGHGDEVGT
ncbi:MAG: hypothetical protein Q9215_005526 [Flavoplaca cf. flavocitrina]